MTLEDGTVFDSSENHGKPLEFKVGAGQLIKGFESEIKGMEAGDEKQFKLQPSDAYGEYMQDMVEELPKEQFPDEIEPDMMVLMGIPNGVEIPAKITIIRDDMVTVDLNHPLAGKTLTFTVKILEIS